MKHYVSKTILRYFFPKEIYKSSQLTSKYVIVWFKEFYVNYVKIIRLFK